MYSWWDKGMETADVGPAVITTQLNKYCEKKCEGEQISCGPIFLLCMNSITTSYKHLSIK